MLHTIRHSHLAVADIQRNFLSHEVLHGGFAAHLFDQLRGADLAAQ